MANKCRNLVFFKDEEEIICKYLGGNILETLDNIGKAILDLPEDEEDMTVENLMYRVIGKLAYYPNDSFFILEEEAALAKELENDAIENEHENENENENENEEEYECEDDDEDDEDDYDPYDDSKFSNYSSVHTGIDPDYSLFS